jgi:hypothetical protein
MGLNQKLTITGLRKVDTRAKNGTRSSSLGMRHSLLSTFLFVYFARPASINCEENVSIYTSDFVDTVYQLPLLQNNTAVKLFTQIGSSAKC